MLSDFGQAIDPHNRGIALERAGEYEKALLQFQLAIDRNPSDAYSYNEIAWLYVDKFEINYDLAIKFATTAVSIAKERNYHDRLLANYLDTLGWANYKNGNIESAQALYEELVILDSAKEFMHHYEIVFDAISE